LNNLAIDQSQQKLDYEEQIERLTKETYVLKTKEKELQKTLEEYQKKKSESEEMEPSSLHYVKVEGNKAATERLADYVLSNITFDSY